MAGVQEGQAQMKIDGPGKWLRIYLGESDHWHGKPLYQAIVELLRREGMAGATVLRGIEGFGANSRIHTARILRLSEDLPVVVEVIDQADRIERVLPMLDEMVGEGLMTLMDVSIVFYRHGADIVSESQEGA
jgi:PII-like signaling protein